MRIGFFGCSFTEGGGLDGVEWNKYALKNKLIPSKATLKTGDDSTASEILFLILATRSDGVSPKNFNVKWMFPGRTQEGFKSRVLNRFCIEITVSLAWGGISIARNNLRTDIVYQGLRNNVKRVSSVQTGPAVPWDY